MANLKKLQPYFHRKGARQRIILYLLASGYSVNELLSFKLSDLSKVTLPESLEIYREEILLNSSKWAFEYSPERRFNSYDFFNLVRTTTRKVLGHEIPINRFQQLTE